MTRVQPSARALARVLCRSPHTRPWFESRSQHKAVLALALANHRGTPLQKVTILTNRGAWRNGCAPLDAAPSGRHRRRRGPFRRLAALRTRASCRGGCTLQPCWQLHTPIGNAHANHWRIGRCTRWGRNRGRDGWGRRHWWWRPRVRRNVHGQMLLEVVLDAILAVDRCGPSQIRRES